MPATSAISAALIQAFQDPVWCPAKPNSQGETNRIAARARLTVYGVVFSACDQFPHVDLLGKSCSLEESWTHSGSSTGSPEVLGTWLLQTRRDRASTSCFQVSRRARPFKGQVNGQCLQVNAEQRGECRTTMCGSCGHRVQGTLTVGPARQARTASAPAPDTDLLKPAYLILVLQAQVRHVPRRLA
jgi:hypothetical protein